MLQSINSLQQYNSNDALKNLAPLREYKECKLFFHCNEEHILLDKNPENALLKKDFCTLMHKSTIFQDLHCRTILV